MPTSETKLSFKFGHTSGKVIKTTMYTIDRCNGRKWFFSELPEASGMNVQDRILTCFVYYLLFLPFLFG